MYNVFGYYYDVLSRTVVSFCIFFCKRGDSSVLFAYSFLLLFGQFENIYKVEQDFLYFFLEWDLRTFVKEKEI